MNYKEQVLSHLNDHLIPDVSKIVTEYIGNKEYHFRKAEIFDKMWKCVKIHREVINDGSKALPLELEFGTILNKYIDSHPSKRRYDAKFKPTRKQWNRDISYIRDIGYQNKMTKYIKYNFKIPTLGKIRCGNCGNIKEISRMTYVGKPKYSYTCC